MTMPRGLTVASGIDVLTHAIESFVSVLASDYTKPYSLESMKIAVQIFTRISRKRSKSSKSKRKNVKRIMFSRNLFANAFLGNLSLIST